MYTHVSCDVRSDLNCSAFVETDGTSKLEFQLNVTVANYNIAAIFKLISSHNRQKNEFKL